MPHFTIHILLSNYSFCVHVLVPLLDPFLEIFMPPTNSQTATVPTVSGRSSLENLVGLAPAMTAWAMPHSPGCHDGG